MTPNVQSGSDTPSFSAFATEVVRLTNVERAKVGCGAVSANSALRAAAQGHSQDMATKGYFSHASQDGRTMADRVSAAGYAWGALGENIAAGQATPAAVMSGWMNSSGHKANILNCTYKDLGVGVAKNSSGTIYWTQNFGAKP